MTLSKQLRWFLIGLLFVSTVAQAVDGGRVSTGGDPFNIRLEYTRQLVVNTLRRLVSRYWMDPEGTRKKLAHSCRTMTGSVIPGRSDTCVDFIITTAQLMQMCNEGPGKIEFAPVIPKTQDEEDQFLADYGGKFPRPVSAWTLHDCGSPIYFHYERARELRVRDLFGLLVHEFGHKIKYQGLEIEDPKPVGAFPHGADLLDAVGVALWLYGLYEGTVPNDIRNVYPEVKHVFDCNLTINSEESVHFEFFNKVFSTDSGYLSTNSADNGFGYELSKFTERAFPNRRIFLKTHFEGKTCETTSTLDISIALLLENGQSKPLDANIDHKNFLCVYATESLFTLNYVEKLEPEGSRLKVECRFVGSYLVNVGGG